MKRALLLIAAGAGLATACSDPTPQAFDQLTLDRPIDVAFACYGEMRETNGGAANEQQPISVTAQPLFGCASLSPRLAKLPNEMVDPVQRAPGQDDMNGRPTPTAWYAFILQSVSGTVAIARWPVTPADRMTVNTTSNDASRDMTLLDADLLTPGQNAITIGEDPVAIATDKTGCYAITANAGSCDLSELEINSALDKATLSTRSEPVRVDRLGVRNAANTVIRARPAAMVAEPGITTVGTACPATATGKVYVAYPGCRLVAGVDTSNGRIVSGIQFDGVGVPTVLKGAALDNVTCPDECAGAGTAAASDVRPVALDLRLDTRIDRVNAGSKPAVTLRLAIGADVRGTTARPLTIVKLDPASANPVDPATDPQALVQIALESRVSVTAVALSPQIGMGGQVSGTGTTTDDTPADHQGQYVYAVASDGTVRVADVLNQRRECDTQADARFLQGAMVTDMMCIDAASPTRPPRRSGARGPGVELPNGAVPSSVAIVKAREQAPQLFDTMGTRTGETQPGPGVWVGHFAVVTSSNGASYAVNVDDDYAPDDVVAGNFSTLPVLVAPHQLRDNFSRRDKGPEIVAMANMTADACAPADPLMGVLGGGPRVTSAPAPGVPSNTLASDKFPELPQPLRVRCQEGGVGDPANRPVKDYSLSQLEFGAPKDERARVYPDLRAISTEAWNLTYEGILSLDNSIHSVDGPPIRVGTLTVDSFGMHLHDPARPFCDVGVEPFDIAELRGCDPANNDADCPRGYTCFLHPNYVNPPNGASVGACMLKSEAPRLADACRDFLTTRRRYTVGPRVDNGTVTLLERRHELTMMPIEGCESDAQCNALAQLARTIDASADPFVDHETNWSCQTDPLRAPINSEPARNKRCVQTCVFNPSPGNPDPFKCASGSVCRSLIHFDPRQPPPQDLPGLCLEGVEPPQVCLNGPQRYNFRASEAFTMIGGLSGYVHPWVEQNGTCVRPPLDPAGPGPVQIGRIPLRVPACALPATDTRGQLPGGGFDANPCALTASQFDSVLPDPVACDAVPGNRGTGVFDFRDTPAIKFRNRAMTITMADRYRTCQLAPPRGSPAGTPSTSVNLAFAITGYQVEFAQKAGFAPNTFTLPLLATTSPVKAVRGPTDSIWVIDNGDYLSNTQSSRGHVYRIESVSVGIVNMLPE